MNAIKLRNILLIVVFLLVASMVAGTWELQRLLAEQVKLTDHAKIDADLSQLEQQKLQKLQIDLANKKDIISRTRQIAATSGQYQYQDQVIRDLTAYATRQGIAISSFDFGAQAATGSKTTPVDKTTFTVNLQTPLRFDQFLNFLRSIESNATKLQVNSISLAPDPRAPGQVLNPTIGIGVYLKK